MPKPTEVPLNSLRQATPELEIQGPTPQELPATWLYGESIPLTATGGDGRYQWLTTAPKAVSLKQRQDNRCEVAIEGTAAAPILAFSAGDAAIYKGLKGNRPLLKAADNTPRNYLEAERYCQQAGGSLPSQKTIEAVLKARKTAVIAWARSSFPVALGTSLSIWLKAEKVAAHSGQPSINLETATYSDQTKAIEAKQNEIKVKKNSLQALKDKELALLEKGANLSEEKIKTTTENSATRKAIEDGNIVTHFTPEGNITGIKPDNYGENYIKQSVDKALNEHHENQTALRAIQEELHTAQGDIKGQWKELVDLKIQQAKFKAHLGGPSINLETAACFDQTEAIETKQNAIEAKQTSLQALKDKEQALLTKGANLPEAEIIKNAENTATKIAIENGDFVHSWKPDDGGITNIKPNDKGDAFIKEYLDKVVAEHHEKHTALSDLREKLHTAQGDIKALWKELGDLKIQQAKEGTTPYTLCQFNPVTLDQAVASWVPDTGEATPGDRFTTGQCSSQRSGDSPQLPHCQFNP